MVYKTASNPCGHGNLDHADYFYISTTKSVVKKYEYQLCSLVLIYGLFLHINETVKNINHNIDAQYLKFLL